MAIGTNLSLLILLALLCLGYQLFFTATKAAIAKSKSYRLREMARENIAVSLARIVLINAEKHIISAQLGFFVSTLGLSLSVVEAFVLVPPAYLSNSGSRIPWLASLAIALTVVAMISLSLCQVVKAVASTNPEETLRRLALPQIIITRLSTPLVWVLRRMTRGLFSLIGVQAQMGRESAATPEEISAMLELSSEAGTIAEDEKDMIQGVFTFSDTLVREVMTPRVRIVAVEESDSLNVVRDVLIKEGLSRVLVIGKDLDDVRGILNSKDLIEFINQPEKTFNLTQVMRKPYFVANSKKIDDLLQEMRREAIHLAVVLDEHGGVDGLVTIEDLLEEIVGEIFDEYDLPLEEIDVRKIGGGDLLVAGKVLIDDLNRMYKLNLPAGQGQYDTVAGYLMKELGRVPKSGEVLLLNGLKIRVEKVEQNQLQTLRLFVGKKSSTHSISTLKDSLLGQPKVTTRIQKAS